MSLTIDDFAKVDKGLFTKSFHSLKPAVANVAGFIEIYESKKEIIYGEAIILPEIASLKEKAENMRSDAIKYYRRLCILEKMARGIGPESDVNITKRFTNHAIGMYQKILDFKDSLTSIIDNAIPKDSTDIKIINYLIASRDSIEENFSATYNLEKKAKVNYTPVKDLIDMVLQYNKKNTSGIVVEMNISEEDKKLAIRPEYAKLIIRNILHNADFYADPNHHLILNAHNQTLLADGKQAYTFTFINKIKPNVINPVSSGRGNKDSKDMTANFGGIYIAEPISNTNMYSVNWIVPTYDKAA